MVAAIKDTPVGDIKAKKASSKYYEKHYEIIATKAPKEHYSWSRDERDAYLSTVSHMIGAAWFDPLRDCWAFSSVNVNGGTEEVGLKKGDVETLGEAMFELYDHYLETDFRGLVMSHLLSHHQAAEGGFDDDANGAWCVEDLVDYHKDQHGSVVKVNGNYRAYTKDHPADHPVSDLSTRNLEDTETEAEEATEDNWLASQRDRVDYMRAMAELSHEIFTVIEEVMEMGHLDEEDVVTVLGGYVMNTVGLQE